MRTAHFARRANLSRSICLRRRANHWLKLACLAPDQEGRIAIVTDVGRGMRWTLWAAQDERGHDRLVSELIRQPNRRVGSGGVGYRPNFEFQ